MDDNNDDRIQRDAEEIALAAVDIERQRSVESAGEARERDIDAQITELQHDRAQVDAERRSAHDREVADEKVIADRDRDLREVLGGIGSSNAGSGGPGGPGGGPVPGPGPAPGPGGPPVVPPRRVG